MALIIRAIWLLGDTTLSQPRNVLMLPPLSVQTGVTQPSVCFNFACLNCFANRAGGAYIMVCTPTQKRPTKMEIGLIQSPLSAKFIELQGFPYIQHCHLQYLLFQQANHGRNTQFFPHHKQVNVTHVLFLVRTRYNYFLTPYEQGILVMYRVC